jgi:hypothetical protein
MKLYFKKTESGDIQVQIEKGTVLNDFDYVEMLSQLMQENTIVCDWGNLDEQEKSKMNELLDKIKVAVTTGMEKSLE